MKIKHNTQNALYMAKKMECLPGNILAKEMVLMNPLGYYLDLTITRSFADEIECPFDNIHAPTLRLIYQTANDTFFISKRTYDVRTNTTVYEPIFIDPDINRSLFCSMID